MFNLQHRCADQSFRHCLLITSLLLVTLLGTHSESHFRTTSIGSYVHRDFDIRLSCRGFVIGWTFTIGHFQPEIEIESESEAYVSDLDVAADEQNRQLKAFFEAYFEKVPDKLLRSTVLFDIEQGQCSVKPFSIDKGARTDFESTIKVKGYSRKHGLVGIKCSERSNEPDSFRVFNSRLK